MSRRGGWESSGHSVPFLCHHGKTWALEQGFPMSGLSPQERRQTGAGVRGGGRDGAGPAPGTAQLQALLPGWVGSGGGRSWQSWPCNLPLTLQRLAILPKSHT